MSNLPSASEVFDPIKDRFRTANTNEEYRKATMDNAHHLVQSYFLQSNQYTLTEHGPLSNPITMANGRKIAVEETLLLEVRQADTGQTSTVMLAVNAPSGDGEAMRASINKLSELLDEMKESRGLWAAFAIRLEREMMAPFEFHPERGASNLPEEPD